jgi:hypothetical protein
VYGRNCVLPGDIEFTIDVYKFAHEMQITSLLKPLECKFAQVQPGQVMAVFDAIRILDHEQQNLLTCCKKVISKMNYFLLYCSNYVSEVH